MIFVIAVLLIVGALSFTLYIHPKALPAPAPVSPYQHLDERKAAIYENLRDLQFEYRVGKLSEADYQTIKLGLQKELALVLAEIDRIKQRAGESVEPAAEAAAAVAAETAVAAPAPAATTATVCPHCGAKFARSMKFCGECGQAMGGAA